jgi:tRNA modification GTPase
LSEDFPCSDLRIAYELLGEITGDTTSEDVLKKIFERFCIGK